MTEKAPEILWHYTSIDTLVKICTNLTMRATHYAFMNDVEEVKFGANAILEKIKQKNFPEEWTEKIELIKNQLEKYIAGGNTKEFYIISLSLAADSLPLWRGYTPHQGGCAIAFSRTALSTIFQNYNFLKSKNVLLEPCIYEHTDIGRFDIKIGLVTMWKIFNDAFNDLIGSPVCCFKNSCFKEEQEARLVFERNAKTEVCFENSKPFIELQMVKKNFPSLIKEVMISPHGNVNNNEQYVRFFSRYLGEKYGTSSSDGLLFPVTKSKLPYRG